jgi:hypothetical protein
MHQRKLVHFFYLYSAKIIIMKTYIIITSIIIGLFFSCNSSKDYTFRESSNSKIESDTIKIVNEELEYEIIIIDGGFSSWIYTFAKPRGFYSQSYLETRNKLWVQEWNQRVNLPSQYLNLYELPISYENGINYGYEVNYMLYNYLVYFQLKNNQKLGFYPARR